MTVLPLVFNPAARGGRGRPHRGRLAVVAAAHGFELDWWPTESPGHATELARRAVRGGKTILGVWGGDGTYNEVAQALVGTETALLILPGGTTSVLAYELGIPRSPENALAAQLSGERRAMTVGRTSHGRIFLLMVSAGPDSVILANIPATLKSHAGKLGIGVQAAFEFLRGNLPHVQVRLDGEEMDTAWCITGNARCYGGPYQATPGSDPFSPGFEVVTLHRHGRNAVVPFFFAIPSGRHLTMPAVRHKAAREVELSSEDPVPYQLDGDVGGTLPVTLRATDERVWVLVPKSPASSGK